MIDDAETAHPGGPIYAEGQSTAMTDGEPIAVSPSSDEAEPTRRVIEQQSECL